jgi:hypothetical protein
MKSEPDIVFCNPKKRELSPFMAEQLLYDYATKNIDTLRESAVADAIRNSPELAKELDDIIYGMTYCHHLQKTTLTTEFLDRLKSPLKWPARVKSYRNFRTWNQSTIWLLEAVGISLLVLLFTLAIPWPKYFKLFLERQNPDLFLSEAPKDPSFSQVPESLPVISSKQFSDYRVKAELGAVNTEFTVNKIIANLPRHGASIEHHSLRKALRGDVTPFFKISIPSAKTETLLKELNSLGQLTWVTPPNENEKGSNIFGIEVWVVRQDPPREKKLPQDEKRE